MMIDLTVTLLVVLSTIIDYSVEAQCYTDSGEHCTDNSAVVPGAFFFFAKHEYLVITNTYQK